MSPGPIQASCPACGAPVTFKTGSSIVVVCEFCHSVVARGDRALEDLGKVAEIIQTGSPLQVGLRGVYQRVPFELTGRAQLGHEAGGVWDEWYAAFSDGRWGWLAEAQGRFYMTFQEDLPEQALIPTFDALELGQPVAAIRSSVPLMVAEKGEASAIAAEGEIPYKLIPGESHYYADLSGPQGVFATLDYSESPPLIFVGREVQFSELGFPPTVVAPEREARRVSALQLSCPQCGGPLELRAPDRTERVTCPNCGSLLDVNQGRLEFLKALEPPRVQPVIPIGATGELFGAQFVMIGFVQRSMEYEGIRYYWEEYLLYNTQVGFRWLVRSDDNWSFVETVPPGEVVEKRSYPPKKGDTAIYRGERYKLYQDTVARVELVLGEFYWKVEAGELVRATDYIHPPRMLSKEVSAFTPSDAPETEATEWQPKKKRQRRKVQRAVETGEINWSLGTYVKPKDVERAFNISGLPRPSKIGWNQPFPHKAIYKYWLWLLLATLAVSIIIFATSSPRLVLEQDYQINPGANENNPQAIFIEGINLEPRKNIRMVFSSNVNNSWVGVAGGLINEATDEAQPFSTDVEYYYGVEDGESWSEGSKESDVYLSAVEGGTYMLQLEVAGDKLQQSSTLHVRVEQGVPRLLHLFVALLINSIIPIIVAIYQFSFEKRRWEDSDYSPFSS